MHHENRTLALSSALYDRVRSAMTAALAGEAADADPLIRVSAHADFQVDGLLPLAKRLRANPRQLADRVAVHLPADGLLAAVEVSGPGFINLTLTDTVIWHQLARRAADPRLGVPITPAGPVVVEYSQPNTAKEMHVGHLRSTVIGDALARCLAFTGATVIRQNHIGDWGTQFGMLIQHLIEDPGPTREPTEETGASAISHLNALYRAARSRFDTDPAFADRSRGRVVALQSGDDDTVAAWREIVNESKVYFNDIYGRLDVLLTDADIVGESFYNPQLPALAADLEQRGVAVTSDGALCVFFDDVSGPDGQPVPLIVRKRDGGFGYGITDLAAVRHRVDALGATRILYVVDARQALHFRMIFETARRAGYLPTDVEAVHVVFGSVLGRDGKPFKTRAGDTVRLSSLLDEAVERARQTVAEKNPGLDPDTLDRRAREVGIGAVKYADLATSRTRDYIFDLDRMISLQGNTGVYLQYAHARIRSILRRLPAGPAPVVDPGVRLDPAERALALALDEFPAVITAVVDTLEPHRLCTYLFGLAQVFSDFYEQCPVVRAADLAVQANRAIMCRLTGDTLKLGLDLLGIAAPDRI